MNTVALPIEQQVNGVAGMLYMQSTSAADGTYSLVVTFAIGTDLNFAQVLVQNRVAQAMASLPQAVQVQGVTVQQKSTAILQIVTLTSTDPRYDSLLPLATTRPSHWSTSCPACLASAMSTCSASGEYSMRIWLDPNKLYARGLTPQDVIQRHPAAEPAGRPPARSACRRHRPDQDFQYTINVVGRLADPAQFADIIVKVDSANGGRRSRIKDIGRVELGAQTYSQDLQAERQAIRRPGDLAAPTPMRWPWQRRSTPRWRSSRRLSAGAQLQRPVRYHALRQCLDQ